MPEAFVELLKMNRWSNLLVLDLCAGLDDAQLDAVFSGTFGSLRATLLHLIGNEEYYLESVTGSAPETTLRQAAANGFPGFQELKRRASETGSRLVKAAEALQDGDIIRGTYRGSPFEMPKMIPLMQAVHHGDEHRAQIKHILTHLGVQHPEMDVWQYHSEQMQDR